MMKFIKDIDIKNKKVLIRCDFNVPIKENVILDDYRILKTIPTLSYCIDQGASMILMSHLGRPNKDNYKNLSLRAVAEYLSKYYKKDVFFSEDCISKESIETSSKLSAGQIHVIENLRFHKEELENNDIFSKKLAMHGDVYINDAFGTSHRSHSSNASILKYFKIKGIGLLMKDEFRYLSEFKKSKSCVIIGGAKISTKIKMIDHFINRTSNIIVGGAMAFTFIKSQGKEIGLSLVEEDMLKTAENILIKAKDNNCNIHLPVDIMSAKSFSNESECTNVHIDSISSDMMGLDIGEKTISSFKNIVFNSKVVIWNGPLGAFELSKFSNGTNSIAAYISKLTRGGLLKSIVGGGDTASAINNAGLINGFSHVSTGGGASLKLLSGEELEIMKNWKIYE